MGDTIGTVYRFNNKIVVKLVNARLILKSWYSMIKLSDDKRALIPFQYNATIGIDDQADTIIGTVGSNDDDKILIRLFTTNEWWIVGIRQPDGHFIVSRPSWDDQVEFEKHWINN